MSTARRWSRRRAARRAPAGRSPHSGTNTPGVRLALALLTALAAARAAVLVLRPSDGLIEPDPVDIDAYFPPDDIARARRYGRPQLALHAAAGLTQLGVLGVFCVNAQRLPGGVNAADGRAAGASAPRVGERGEAAAVATGLTLALAVAPLPLQALARRRALAAGLATQSWRGWAADLLKGGALGLALNVGTAPLAVALMRRFPRRWWLAGSGVAAAGAGMLTFVAPLVLDPLFNRFTPLPAGALRAEVLALAARAGVRVGEVYEVDASRRTTAANAYVSGFGASRRVVLFDTLLSGLKHDEVRLVVAHELAHVRHRDVPRGLAQLALSAPAGMYAVAQLTRRLDRSRGTAPSAATLPALGLSLALVSSAIGSVGCGLSRAVERRADAFALSLADAPEPFISFEQRIVAQNLADPDPPRWLLALLGTHPAAVERIGIARAYARGARPSGGS
jgi:STE24 endopeptidase